MSITKVGTGSIPSFQVDATTSTQATPKPTQTTPSLQTNQFTTGSPTAPTEAKKPGLTRSLNTRAAAPQAAPQNTGLTNLASQNGLRSNQDLINHFYKQGGGNWDGAQAVARQNGVDLNDLVRNRQGAINTNERPVLGGELGQVAAQNGLHTNQDLINHFYKQGGGTWDGAQAAAQRMGSDLNQLTRDRQGTVRVPGTTPGGTQPAGTQPAGTQPAGTQPAGTQPAGTQPAGTQPTAPTAPAGQEPVTGDQAQRVLGAARNELALGVRENAGNNEDREGNIRRYRNAVTAPGYRQNRGPEAWCADFVSHVYKEAGKPLGPNGGGFAAVSQMKSWLQQNGKFHTSNPQPGDIAFFRDFSHVAIIEKINADGTVTTIEGNTSPNGGGQEGLHRKTRRLSGISGFGRP